MVPANKDVLMKKLKILLQNLTRSKIIPAIVGDKACHQYAEFLVKDMELLQLDGGKRDCQDEFFFEKADIAKFPKLCSSFDHYPYFKSWTS